MASEILKHDENTIRVLGGITDDAAQEIRMVRVSPITGRVLVTGTGGGSGITSINSDTTAAQVIAVGTAGTDFAIVDNGTGTHTLNLPTASHTNRGALSSADWDTFNGKQASGNYITALTGDVTASGPGSVAATLATVNSNVGTFGSATQASQVTVNGKGLVTAASNVTVTPAVGSITGLGTGVATALAINVGTAGSPVINGGALGTPSSGTATNLTGTASGLTAGNVTTNANLTGVITSSGNATSIASQTGTGTKFVVDNTPTLITPVLGVATATSVNKVTITAPATSAVLTIPDGVTLTGPASSGTAATLGNAETFTGAKTVTKLVQTVTAMGAQALDGSLGNVFTRTLAGNETFTQSNFSTGQCFMVVVKQGSGTSYTVTWFATVTWITSGATAPTQTTTTNGYTSYGFRCTGSNTFEGYLMATQ